MEDVLREAAVQLGILDRLETLSMAANYSRQALDDAREYLHERVPPGQAEHLDVVVHGSYARQEASDQSDFDYLVVAHGLPEDIRSAQQLLAEVDEFIRTRLTPPDETEGKRQPGTTGTFGQIASAPDLTVRIGLEQDTNVSHTRRLLILEESASIYRPELRRELLKAILRRYLADYPEPKEGVPRFLLNDVLRFWYTLAVDYQAKRWQRHDKGWGLRYLKLLISRKLGYTGTLVSLLRCDDRAPASVENLTAQFELPPLARLAQLALDDRFDQQDALSRALLLAEEFAAFLRDEGNRERAAALGSSEALQADEELARVREIAEELHSALQAVLFDSFLRRPAHRYLAL